MKTHSTLLIICLVISLGCLGAGYLLAGYWLIFPAFIVAGLFTYFSRKRSVFWSASGLLLACVLLAAIGMLMELSVTLMIVACSAGLAGWELLLFTREMAAIKVRANPAFEKGHLFSLGLAAFAGLALALGSAAIDLQLPFCITAVLALAAMGGLVFAARFRLKQKD